MGSTHTFSKKQELANAITHGIGAVLSLAALVLLIVFASLNGDALQIVSFSIYGVSLLLMFICSTLLHSFPPGRVKNVFEILDHAAIYILIAGTYTPFMLLTVNNKVGWTIFIIIWVLAIGGIVFKVFFVKRFLLFSTILYVVMGWLIIFALEPIAESIPMLGLSFLVIGGVLYTLGAIFYIWRIFYYHHAVWHLFVLVASMLHFFTILLYVE